MSDSIADDLKSEPSPPDPPSRGRGQYGYPTLRDQFAIAALPALIAFVEGVALVDQPDLVFAEIADDAYALADAMLEAREFVPDEDDEAAE